MIYCYNKLLSLSDIIYHIVMDTPYIDFAHIDYKEPVILCGDCRKLIVNIPSASIDTIITSPPYWHERIYPGSLIGEEEDLEEYINNLVAIFRDLKRLVKPTGSLWLNIGDTFCDQTWQNVPAKLAIALANDGWFLKDEVIWEKANGGLSSRTNRLRPSHEMVFHFTIEANNYYFEDEAIRETKPLVKKASGKSRTGVSGVVYQKKIEESPFLSYREKRKAKAALKRVLKRMKDGYIDDFRMVIRGVEKTTHSNNIKISGRAEELERNGYYFLFYNPKGPIPSDVWCIHASSGRLSKEFSSSFPPELCRIPLLATCPPDGVALDPFAGLGSMAFMAKALHRKSVSFEINPDNVAIAEKRCSDG